MAVIKLGVMNDKIQDARDDIHRAETLLRDAKNALDAALRGDNVADVQSKLNINRFEDCKDEGDELFIRFENNDWTVGGNQLAEIKKLGYRVDYIGDINSHKTIVICFKKI